MRLAHWGVEVCWEIPEEMEVCEFLEYVALKLAVVVVMTRVVQLSRKCDDWWWRERWGG